MLPFPPLSRGVPRKRGRRGGNEKTSERDKKKDKKQDAIEGKGRYKEGLDTICVTRDSDGNIHSFQNITHTIVSDEFEALSARSANLLVTHG